MRFRVFASKDAPEKEAAGKKKKKREKRKRKSHGKGLKNQKVSVGGGVGAVVFLVVSVC